VSYTKASLADLEAAGAAATDTGAAAVDSGERAGAFSAEMEAGVDEVTAALWTHVEQLATRLRDEANSAMQKLGAADWEGQSREMAQAAESSLHARLDATLVTAQDGTQRFRATTMEQADAFVAGVRGQFAGVLASVDVAYRDLAQAEATFAANLQQADQTIRFE
jgi:hypothetical protein